MKIVVCDQTGAGPRLPARIDGSGNWIEEADLSYEINEPDAYALEEGLQLKEKHGGEVVVLCAGPARAAQTIREALAKGADRAIHIEEEDRRLRSAGSRAADGGGAQAPRSPTWFLPVCSRTTWAMGRPA